MGKGPKNRKRKGKEVAKATQASVSDDQGVDPSLSTSAEQEVSSVVAGHNPETERVDESMPQEGVPVVAAQKRLRSAANQRGDPPLATSHAEQVQEVSALVAGGNKEEERVDASDPQEGDPVVSAAKRLWSAAKQKGTQIADQGVDPPPAISAEQEVSGLVAAGDKEKDAVLDKSDRSTNNSRDDSNDTEHELFRGRLFYNSPFNLYERFIPPNEWNREDDTTLPLHTMKQQKITWVQDWLG